jgi:hypothetical protein
MVMLAILLGSLLQGVEVDITGPTLWEELCDLVTVGTTDAVLQVIQLQKTCHGSTARRWINITTSVSSWYPCKNITSGLPTIQYNESDKLGATYSTWPWSNYCSILKMPGGTEENNEKREHSGVPRQPETMPTYAPRNSEVPA